MRSRCPSPKALSSSAGCSRGSSSNSGTRFPRRTSLFRRVPFGPLIRDNFILPPSSGPAFVQLAAQFFDALIQNNQRLPELKQLGVPVKLIWGEFDPYITVAVAERRKSQLKHASLTVVPAGHWLQVDEPKQVALAMLSKASTAAG